MVISEHFRNLISWGRLPTLTKDNKYVTPMTSHEYIEHIMIPEASILLIQDDLAMEKGLATTKGRASVRKEAEEIWKASAEYGKWKFRESSEQYGQLVDELLSAKSIMLRKFSKAWNEADKVDKAKKENVEPEKRQKKREAEVQEGRAGEGSGTKKTKSARTSEILVLDSPNFSSSSGSTTSSASHLDYEVTGGRISSKTHRNPSKRSSSISTPGKTGSNGSSPTSHSSVRTAHTSSAVNHRMNQMGIDYSNPTPVPLRVSPTNIPLSSNTNKFPSGAGKREFKEVESFDSGYGDEAWGMDDIAMIESMEKKIVVPQRAGR
jgi:hypothetical protein